VEKQKNGGGLADWRNFLRKRAGRKDISRLSTGAAMTKEEGLPLGKGSDRESVNSYHKYPGLLRGEAGETGFDSLLRLA